jgi:uncharacterized repeat protein (TIGR02543 family)
MIRAGAVVRVLVVIAVMLAAGSGFAEDANHERGFTPAKLYQFGGLDNVSLFNGNLTVQIPIGTRYPVSEGLSYQLTLSYNSEVWDHEEVERIGPIPIDPTKFLHAIPTQRSNAGLGWMVTLGELRDFAKHPNDSPGVGYVSSDGGVHEGLGGTALVTNARITADGRYTRRYDVNGVRRVEFPDGSFQTFHPDGTLATMSDRYGNTLTMDVLVDSNGQHTWHITDKHGRSHYVYFKKWLGAQSGGDRGQNRPLTANYSEVIDRIVVAGVNGDETYQFVYANRNGAVDQNDEIFISCEGLVDGWDTSFKVPILRKIVLPDGSSYAMDYNILGPGDVRDCELQFGALKNLTLPTLGQIHWDYGSYRFPGTDCVHHSWSSTTSGVRAKKLLDAQGAEIGAWTYEPTLQHIADQPCPDGHPASHVAQELVNTITTPLGHKEVNYFSAWPTHDVYEESPQGVISSEYGFPASRLHPDASGTRFLQTEIFDCAGGTCPPTPARRIYVAFDMTAGSDHRVRTRRTLYDDGSYVDADYSEFDGLGHYRTTTETSVVAGTTDVHTSTTNYNRRDDRVDPAGFDSGNFPNNTLPGPSQPWILETYTSQSATEGASTSSTLFYFNPQGFLTKSRTLAATAAGDLMTVLTRDSVTGEVTAESHFGGDLTSVGGETTPLATFEPANPSYKVSHGYSWGVRSSSTVDMGANATLKVLDLVIDQNSGTPTSSKDAGGLTTSFEYGVMGRPKAVRPPASPWTEYLFTNATGSASANVSVRQHAYGDSAYDTPVTETTTDFDGQGRPTLTTTTMPDGQVAKRLVAYNAGGLTATSSEWETTPTHFTIFGNYDPFGRVRSVTAPDAKTSTVTYTGLSVQRTQSIATSANAEAPVSTTERYDGFDRLRSVIEPSGGADTAQPYGSDVTTSYDYDVAGRLTRAVTSGSLQPRTFVYDARGFLQSETHPENGTTTYEQYDARGHFRLKKTGAGSAYELHYTYDKAERLTSVSDAAGSLLKEFVFDQNSDTAHPSFGPGRLLKTVRHNRSTTLGDVTVVSYFDYDGAGRVSDKQTVVGGGPAFTQQFTFNSSGLPDVLHYPTCPQCGTATKSDRQIALTYARGFLSGVAGFANAIAYWPNGMVKSVQHAGSGTAVVTDTQSIDPTTGMARPDSIDFTGYCIGPSISMSAPANPATIASGASVTLTIPAPAGVNGPTYQWYRGTRGDTSQPINGANGATYSTGALTSQASFWVRVSDGSCSSDSRTVVVSVRDCEAVHIVEQPQSANIATGGTATLTVSASDSGAHYQWYSGTRGDTSSPIAGAQSSTYVTAPLSQEARFWVRVFSSDQACAVDSDTATIGICASAPSIASPPVNQQVNVFYGPQDATATVVANGDGLLTYTWTRVDTGATIIHANRGTSDTLAVPFSAPGSVQYKVKVENTCGQSAISAAVTLSAVSVSCNWSLSVATALQVPAPGVTVPVIAGVDPMPDSGAQYTFEWRNRAGSVISQQQTANLTANPFTWFDLTVVRTCDGSGVAQTRRIYVYADRSCPIMPVAVDPAQVELVPGATTTLTASTEWPLNVTYQWYEGRPGDTRKPKTAVAGSPHKLQVVAKPAHYWVRITNACGLTRDSVAVVVKVNNGTTTCTPVVITQQPLSQEIAGGAQTTLTVDASGTPVPSIFSWTEETNPPTVIPNNYSRTLVVAPQVTKTYWARASTSCGASADSNYAIVHVVSCGTNHVLTQPQDTATDNEHAVTLSVTVADPSSVTYQWYEGESGDTSHPAGSTTSSFTTPLLGAWTRYWVRMNAANQCSFDSHAASVSVCVKPSYAAMLPFEETVQAGTYRSFFATAVGTDLTYQWYIGATPESATPVAGATSDTIYIQATQTTIYWVKATNGCGSAWSKRVRVTVCPTITQQPSVPGEIMPNTTAVVTMAASGADLTYQWYQGASGDTSHQLNFHGPSFTTEPLTADTSYWAVVTSGVCPVLTDVVTVHVCNDTMVNWMSSSQTIHSTQTVTLSVSATPAPGDGAQLYWYSGTPGNVAASTLINGPTPFTSQLVSPLQTTTYWVRVKKSNSVCYADTGALVLTVDDARPINVTISGNGTVSSAPGGINCPTTCSTFYPNNSGVTLYAAAAAGSVFTGWSGACTGTANCALSMTQSRSVTATFVPTNTLTVSIAAGGGGSVTSSPAGINCPTTCSASFAQTSTVTLTAVRAQGYVFAGWTGDCSGLTCQPAMTQNRSVTARFVRPAVPMDFDGDRKSDVFWRNPSTGGNAVWFMNGATATGLSSTTVPDANWQPATFGDFDGDGKSDILWYNSAFHTVAVWFMNGQTLVSSAAPNASVADVNWRVEGNGDFNGDSKSDVFWRNVVTGQTMIWYMSGASVTVSTTTTLALTWRPFAFGDFDGDSRTDIFWRDQSNGSTAIWFLGGSNAALPNTDLNWRVEAAGDFNADGKCDLFWRNAATGATQTWLMNGAAYTATDSLTTADRNWQPVLAGDYDGDGRADIFWLNNATRETRIYFMSGASVLSNTPSLTLAVKQWHPAGTPPLSTIPAVIPGSSDFATASGQTVRLTAPSFTGTTYTWFRGASGDTSAPVTAAIVDNFLDVAPTTSTQYWVQMQNGVVSSRTSTTTVSVCMPTITQQPTSRTIPGNTSTTLTVVSDVPGSTYQWYTGASGNTAAPISSATSASLTVWPATTTSYWVRVTGTCGVSANSASATVTVCQAITQQPTPPGAIDRYGVSGLVVTATGSNLTYQWYAGPAGNTSNPLTGKTASSFSMTMQVSEYYWVRIGSACGTTIDSNSVMVSVRPQIMTHPASTQISSGGSADLSVTAFGSYLHFQWYRGESYDTSHPVGTDSAMLTTGPLYASTPFHCVVTSGNGTVTSNAALVTIQ